MEPSEYMIMAIFIGLGLFSVVASLFNFEWYFSTSGAQTFVRKLGRGGARLFYALLGFALIACGVAGMLYWK
ncbi:MAG: immunity 17 family protein [Tannerellaceae bacterium]